MAKTAEPTKPLKNECDEDHELKEEIKLLVHKVIGSDSKQIPTSLEMLKFLIRTSIDSMTSIPKPIKYLRPYYDTLKIHYKSIPKSTAKLALADIISVLAVGRFDPDVDIDEELECLKYCLEGTMDNIGDWGSEYVRQLELEVIYDKTFDGRKEFIKHVGFPVLMEKILQFDCRPGSEIQLCDFLMEYQDIAVLRQQVTEDNYQRICCYLTACAKNTPDNEMEAIMTTVYHIYMDFKEYCNAMIAALYMTDKEALIVNALAQCPDEVALCQMAFICLRNFPWIRLDPNTRSIDTLNEILSNNSLNSYFLTLARELDVMEPKTPEDIYKLWLDPPPSRLQLFADSSKQNLASVFVNGFVNAGFGSDKLMCGEEGAKWIYKNKTHGMLSAAASMGLIHLWDVCGGLSPIDTYLYMQDDFIKSGALLAVGIVNSRIKHECEPALALLSDYVSSGNDKLQIGSVMGLGLAYAGSNRDDVLELLTPVIKTAPSLEVKALAALSCGLIALGKRNVDVSISIINAMESIIEEDSEALISPYLRLMGLAACLTYYRARDKEFPALLLVKFPPPFSTTVATFYNMCACAGQGDVLTVLSAIRLLEETETEVMEKVNVSSVKRPKKEPPSYWVSHHQNVPLLCAVVGLGDELGTHGMQRIYGHMGQYGSMWAKRSVPIALALTSVSNPKLSVIDILTKYSHDSEVDVACSAIFGLGLVGAGTNNARLAAILRKLALFHAQNPQQLFAVRIAQGLVHLGKGTMTLNPLNTDRMLIDPVGHAGLMIVATAFLEPQSLILGKCHYLLYYLCLSMYPRWLLTLDENLEMVSVPVRVGEAVDTAGKAGTPKTITGIRNQTTPVLLSPSERGELATEAHEHFLPHLDGICVLKEKAIP